MKGRTDIYVLIRNFTYNYVTTDRIYIRSRIGWRSNIYDSIWGRNYLHIVNRGAYLVSILQKEIDNRFYMRDLTRGLFCFYSRKIHGLL